ncbi:MAG: hypothetical protein EZS28_025702, partial [Streblomastix strix]
MDNPEIEQEPTEDRRTCDGSIFVAVRTRPLFAHELRTQEYKNPTILRVENNSVFLLDPNEGSDSKIRRTYKEKLYTFNNSFDVNATNLDVFRYTTSPLIERVFQGFNGTCFCYGMTG